MSIKQKIKQHKKWLDGKADISNRLILRYDILDSQTFHGVDLRDAIFENCILNYCDFSKTNLQGAQFLFSDLRHAKFKKAILNSVYFCECNLYHVDFSRADMEDVQMEDDNFLIDHKSDIKKQAKILSTIINPPAGIISLLNEVTGAINEKKKNARTQKIKKVR
jgi:hypothetical protein